MKEEDNKSELRYLYLAFSIDTYSPDASYSISKDYKITYTTVKQQEFQTSYPDIESEFQLFKIPQAHGFEKI
jgi:hypothetical protein